MLEYNIFYKYDIIFQPVIVGYNDTWVEKCTPELLKLFNSPVQDNTPVTAYGRAAKYYH